MILDLTGGQQFFRGGSEMAGRLLKIDEHLRAGVEPRTMEPRLLKDHRRWHDETEADTMNGSF